MTNGDDLKRTIDSARLMTKLSVFAGIGSLILLIGIRLLLSARGGETMAYVSLPFLFALLFSAASLIYGVFAGRAALEEEEKLLLARRMESRALDVEEDVRFTAGRTLENYRRFAPFVLAVFAALMMGYLLWSIRAAWLARVEAGATEMTGSAVHTALIAAVLMMVALFGGAFFVGQSRAAGFRWLRPAGAWLLTGFFALLLSAVSALCYSNGLGSFDGFCARLLFWIYLVLGVEFPVNFVIEFYRPRSSGEVRPLFESQLLSLFTEPGGVMRNVASALDYQFGFKVSGTWLYGFLERAFIPILLFWALLFWGFTSLHEVGANQVGFRETFGRADRRMLPPGIYWTLPYPFGDLRTFSTTELQRVIIGETAKGADERAAAPVVLWTNQHGGAEEPFIVAVPDEIGADKKENVSGDASISFVRMAIPIEYRIRPEGVWDYAYGNAEPGKILRMIGAEAAAEYFAAATMDELMSHGREKSEKELRQRIQNLADKNSLGVEIVRVGIMDAHPPVERVAPAYQDVIGALEQKETEILQAKAYAAAILPAARADALEIVENARSYSVRIKTVAAAESERFASQLAAYRAMPAMFLLNSSLEMLEEDAKGIRKFIVSSALQDEVYQLNLETRERLDLVDLSASDLSDQK